MKKNMRVWGVALASVLALAIPANGVIMLQDLNSTVMIDPSTRAGMYSWQVDGTDNLYQQWFWYRIGGDGPEQSVDTLRLESADSLGAMAQLVYVDPQGMFDVMIVYSLVGGSAGSGLSDVAETIRIRNLGDSALEFHFFQYSDFDLGDNNQDDVAELVNANTVDQWDDEQILSETVVTPPPNRCEIGAFAATFLSLTDGSPTLLNNNASYGPGDTTWAFQWDPVIAVGGSFIISKDKQIRPVPEVSSTLAMLGCVLVLLGVARRRMTS